MRQWGGCGGCLRPVLRGIRWVAGVSFFHGTCSEAAMVDTFCLFCIILVMMNSVNEKLITKKIKV